MRKLTLNKEKHVLAFERLEQEMEAICKEEQVRLIGGSGGYTWQQLADAFNSGNFNSVPSGSSQVNTDDSVTIDGGWLGEVNITATYTGGCSSGGYSSNGDNWGEFANCFNNPYGMNSPFGDGSGYSSGGYAGDANSGWDVNKDGKLWLIEADRWYRMGNGTPITVPASSVDLSSIDRKLVAGMKVGAAFSVQLLYKNFGGDGTIFGELELIYQGHNKVKIAPNMFDFDTGADKEHPWFDSFGGFFRNVFTKAGEGVATGLGMADGTGTPYWINFSGAATLGKGSR